MLDLRKILTNSFPVRFYDGEESAPGGGGAGLAVADTDSTPTESSEYFEGMPREIAEQAMANDPELRQAIDDKKAARAVQV